MPDPRELPSAGGQSAPPLHVAESGELPSTRTLRLAGIAGLILWLACLSTLFFSFSPSPEDSEDFFLVVPPLIGTSILCVRLVRARHGWVAVIFATLFPLAIFAQEALATWLFGQYSAIDPTVTADEKIVPAAVSTVIWFVIGRLPYGWFSGSGANVRKRLEIAFGLVEALCVVIILGFIAIYLSGGEQNVYDTRARVSELLLAASSAKTALSDGREATGSWSPAWMSGITISAGGHAASGTIGPTGQIIVYGDKSTDYAVVTFTPTVTADNKVVWSLNCSGFPRRRMPAWCRH